jgi:hypothetical protein
MFLIPYKGSAVLIQKYILKRKQGEGRGLKMLRLVRI